MEGLIGCLNKENWDEVSIADKKDDYIEFHVNRSHKQVDDSTFAYMVETDTIDTKKVLLEHATGDPIKNVAVVEMKLNEDGTKIVGMDLDGDVVELKS